MNFAFPLPSEKPLRVPVAYSESFFADTPSTT